MRGGQGPQGLAVLRAEEALLRLADWSDGQKGGCELLFTSPPLWRVGALDMPVSPTAPTPAHSNPGPGPL